MSLELLWEHRRAWARKATLRRVYERYFALVLAEISEHRPIVELGSGPGFFKEYCPEAVATDVAPTPWADRVVDGCALPFPAASIGNLVLIDVFHHLARPLDFLQHARRVLQPGGRVVLLEPWTSLTGYRFYRYIHHEVADRTVDPRQPFSSDKDAFEGNGALPQLYFNPSQMNGRPQLPHGLSYRSLRLLPAVDWLLSGGFRRVGLLPGFLAPLGDALERAARPLARWSALRALIVLERADATAAPQGASSSCSDGSGLTV